MKLHLDIWRQAGPDVQGGFVSYDMDNIVPEMSFLELLDLLNERLELQGNDPIAFEHDCREGVCGSCGFLINGRAHGQLRGVTVCQLHLRHFYDGEHVVIEPWRARAFPVLKDLIVDRAALDRIVQAGGFISVNTGSAPEANSLPVGHTASEQAMDAAACIGCGACIASCKNASAMLFTGAKISQFALVPQGMPERRSRALSMVKAMDAEGFGNCTNERECEGECPKEISFASIARLNREFLSAKFLR